MHRLEFRNLLDFFFLFISTIVFVLVLFFCLFLYFDRAIKVPSASTQFYNLLVLLGTLLFGPRSALFSYVYHFNDGLLNGLLIQVRLSVGSWLLFFIFIIFPFTGSLRIGRFMFFDSFVRLVRPKHLPCGLFIRSVFGVFGLLTSLFLLFSLRLFLFTFSKLVVLF